MDGREIDEGRQLVAAGMKSIVDGAHLQCPYSKATHGNINVVTNVIDTGAATQVA